MVIKFKGKYDTLYIDTEAKLGTLNVNGLVKNIDGSPLVTLHNHMNTLQLGTDKAIKDFVADLMVGQSVYIDTSDAYSNKGYYAELQKRIANRGW
mgnify:CR=1 FL=1